MGRKPKLSLWRFLNLVCPFVLSVSLSKVDDGFHGNSNLKYKLAFALLFFLKIGGSVVQDVFS